MHYNPPLGEVHNVFDLFHNSITLKFDIIVLDSNFTM